MGPVVALGDPLDHRVDDYRNLTDAELRQRQEPAAGLFMVEGPAVIRQLLTSPYPVRSVLVTEARFQQLRPDLEAAPGPWPVYLAGNEVMRAVTGFHFHRGALAAAGRPPAAAWQSVVTGARLIVVAEDIGDHENLGALFRNAAAFGVGAVLLSPGSVDPLYRRAVRVSMGQVLRVPWARAEPWPEVLSDLKEAGWRVLALTPDPAAGELDARLLDARLLDAAEVDPAEVDPAEVDPAETDAAEVSPPEMDAARGGRRPIAVLVGAEGPGLSDGARARADRLVRIAMQPGVDSLNVATAAAIAFHELARGQ